MRILLELELFDVWEIMVRQIIITVTAELQKHKKMPHFDHFSRSGEVDPHENNIFQKWAYIQLHDINFNQSLHLLLFLSDFHKSTETLCNFHTQASCQISRNAL